MNDLHVVVEPERIVTPNLILRQWAADDAPSALEIYGDRSTAAAIGMRQPVSDLAAMRDLLGRWDLQASRSPLPQGRWAVESAQEGELIGGATLLARGQSESELVMGWHLRPRFRGHGVAGQIGHALAHQAFQTSDVAEVFFAAPARNTGSIAVAKRLGMTKAHDLNWERDGVALEVFRMTRDNLHRIQPGISLDSSYDPTGLDDW